MVIAGYKRKVLSPPEQQASNPIWLVGRLDKQLGDSANEMAVTIISLSAQKLGNVQHFASFHDAADEFLVPSRGLCLIICRQTFNSGILAMPGSHTYRSN
jgi:hypothetical protein